MPEQLVELCALFDVTDSPSFEAREKVGNAVGMTNREGAFDSTFRLYSKRDLAQSPPAPGMTRERC